MIRIRGVMIGIVFVVVFGGLLFALFVCQTACNKDLSVDDPPKGVYVIDMICFEIASGDIIWECPVSEIGRHRFPNTPLVRVIGFGKSIGGSKMKINFPCYNSTNKQLISSDARDVDCECCFKDPPLKGEVLKRFNQFKGLSAKALLLYHELDKLLT